MRIRIDTCRASTGINENSVFPIQRCKSGYRREKVREVPGF
ncbi:hypothetical protein HMPREF3033_00944 [Veillonellaceae bacterium DNF00751]|nr:hypothetical protein HMPREF3033_00944 [Veillonellaceae bacterium DNF00751]